MSTERKPLLSDDVVRFKNSPFHVRDFYEDLITSGKLRVVEDVEWINGHGFSIGTCSGCGILALKQHAFCPGCGNKTKRQ